jgi:hypothetical protein
MTVAAAIATPPPTKRIFARIAAAFASSLRRRPSLSLHTVSGQIASELVCSSSARMPK